MRLTILVLLFACGALAGCEVYIEDEHLGGCSGECPEEPCLDGDECEITCEAGPRLSICQGGAWTTPYDTCAPTAPEEGASCAAFTGPGATCEYPRYCPATDAATASCEAGVWRLEPRACEPCGPGACQDGELCVTPLSSELTPFCTAECGGDVEAAGACLEGACEAIGCAYQAGALDRIMCSCL